MGLQQIPLFWETVPMTEKEFIDQSQRANAQETAIEDTMRRLHQATPWDVQDHLIDKGYNWPITSIRRAMTNLTTNGYLEKSSHTVKAGPYGHKSYVWVYPEER